MKTPRIKRLTWTACSAAVLIGLLTFGIKATWASPQQAIATLKSTGNETVQLSIADNTVELTLRNPDGSIQSVHLPISDKAKAAELVQMIGNINSNPTKPQAIEEPYAAAEIIPSEPMSIAVANAPQSADSVPVIAEASAFEGHPNRYQRFTISSRADLAEPAAVKPRRSRTTAFSETTAAAPSTSRTSAFSETTAPTPRRGRKTTASRTASTAAGMTASADIPASASKSSMSSNTGSSLNALPSLQPQPTRATRPMKAPRIVSSLNSVPAIQPSELSVPIQPRVATEVPAPAMTRPILPDTPTKPSRYSQPTQLASPSAPLPPATGSTRRTARASEAELREAIRSLEIRLKALETVQKRVKKFGINRPESIVE